MLRLHIFVSIEMAVRFGGPVSDAEEVSLRAGAIPSNTKSTTDWGIRVWNEWATSRSILLLVSKELFH